MEKIKQAADKLVKQCICRRRIGIRAVVRYGGWGVRLGLIQGRPVTVYKTFGGTRVAFLTRGGNLEEWS